jgi:hypothetical protein
LTSLITAGLVALIAVATLDALQGDGSEASSVAPSTTRGEPTEIAAGGPAIGGPGAVEALRRGGAVGELVYTDPACRTVALRVPDLEPTAFGAAGACSPGPGGDGWTRVEGEAAVPAPPGCRANDAPSWAGCLDTAFRRNDVREALGASDAISIREIAWLGSTRLAAIVRDHGRGLDFVAVLEAGRLVARPSLADPGLSGVGVSPQRRHVAVRTDSGGIYVLDRTGRIALPGRSRLWLLDARAIAWSPDDAWTALAGPGRLYLLETRRSAMEVIELQISAIALDWR